MNPFCQSDGLPKARTHRFYLAFENSLCQDYITEKFFVNSAQFQMVPIVLGGGAVNYLDHVPQHSYIDAADYDGPR